MPGREGEREKGRKGERYGEEWGPGGEATQVISVCQFSQCQVHPIQQVVLSQIMPNIIYLSIYLSIYPSIYLSIGPIAVAIAALMATAMAMAMAVNELVANTIRRIRYK